MVNYLLLKVKNIPSIISTPIFPLVFAYFALINLYLKNYKLVKVNELVLPGILILALLIIVWLISNSLIKNRTKTAIVVSVFFILFFSFGHFLSASTSILLQITGIDLRPLVFSNIGWKMIVVLILWVSIFILFTFFITRINSDFHVTIQFLNVASITLLVLMVYQASRETLVTQNYFSQVESDNNGLTLTCLLYTSPSPRDKS